MASMNQHDVINSGSTLMGVGAQGTLREMELAGECCYFLSQIYPGHFWPVECHDTDNGVDVRVRHIAMQNFPNYCYYISPQDIISPTTLKILLTRAGGELLERCGLQRNKPWDGTVVNQLADIRKNKR